MKTKNYFYAFLLVMLVNSTNTKAWDQEAARYYPLSTGNVYIFNMNDLWLNCNSHELHATYSVRITNTTVKPNGKTYYQFSGWWNMPNESLNWTYQRIDSNSMNVYAYDSSSNSEILIDSLTGNVDDHFNCQRLNPAIPAGWYQRIDQVNVFNSVRNRKQFQCSGPIIADTYYYLTEDIGFSGYSICELGTGVEYTLKGCIINGVVYGDTALTAVHQITSTIPDKFSLSQNYPNPFNPETKINYQIRTSGEVKLGIYDMLGNELEGLINEKQNPGTYSYTFDGSKYTSGVYFYKLIVNGSIIDTKKMVLLK